MFYDYPAVSHERIHNPKGYADYSSFKDWLRDEFKFRCVYCLMRETWSPAGHAIFGIDHVLAKSIHEELKCEYTNLLYCCNRCNFMKATDELPDPCREPFAEHIRVQSDGKVEWMTEDGEKIVKRLRLNDDESVRFRQGMILAARIVVEHPGSETAQLARILMRYPNDLPDLSKLRAPQNSKPDGIAKSHFERRRRRELPDAY
jgi:hypothetical protein